jgi:hypothetical protein
MKRLIRLFFWAGFLIPVFCVSGQTGDGAGTLFGAHFQRPAIEMSTATSGIAEVTCRVGLMGGCCFPLTSHAVTAALTVPSGVTVVSGPDPAQYAALEALPSGTPQVWAAFCWKVRLASENTDGELAVTVSSPDSGQVSGVYAFGRQARIKVGGAHLPEQLTAGKDAELTVDAVCLDDDRYIKQVRFWVGENIPADATDVALAAGAEDQGLLRFMAGGREKTVQGRAIELARKYEPTVWRGTFAAEGSGDVVGVAVATDDKGRSASGPVVRAAVSAAAGKGWRAWLGLKQQTAVQAQPLGYPVDGSAVVYLFLDGGDESKQLAERMERYRREAPHRIHLLCFVEGRTPAPILTALRARYAVGRLPSAVFDGQFRVDGTNVVALTGTLDRCMNKPSPRLSMEVHGGVVAGRDLSLGFIMCNHAAPVSGAPSAASGSMAAFAYENDMPVGTWRCDRVVRHVLQESANYTVPSGLCIPPMMLKWTLPAGAQPKQTGALILLLNEAGKVIDSLCTEKPCGRTGICG